MLPLDPLAHDVILRAEARLRAQNGRRLLATPDLLAACLQDAEVSEIRRRLMPYMRTFREQNEEESTGSIDGDTTSAVAQAMEAADWIARESGHDCIRLRDVMAGLWLASDGLASGTMRAAGLRFSDIVDMDRSQARSSVEVFSAWDTWDAWGMALVGDDDRHL